MLVHPSFSEQAITILEKRYLLKDSKGNLIETPKQMLERVAKALALGSTRSPNSGSDYEDFFNTMASLDFLPNSPTLMNAGTGAGCLSACFVIDLQDSMESIMQCAHDTAIVQKFGGGTGFSGTLLRAKGSYIASTHGQACGPVQVLRTLSAVSSMVTQGGKRDGANMFVLSVHHPDILEFIHCKDDGGIHNFNISVAISNEFMAALKQDRNYALIDHEHRQVSELKARYVWDQIIESAHATGDPGVIFIDRVNDSKANPIPNLERILATNPCGEQPLGPGDSCTLGSINLSNMVSMSEDIIDYLRLERTVRRAVRMLDAVLTVNRYPLETIKTNTLDKRRIGLGVMGWADMLIKLGIPYNSERALELGSRIMNQISLIADNESEYLASVDGPFPLFTDSIYRNDTKIRNATRTTIAPTGTISLLAGCSSGIEPIFAFNFTHHGLEGRLESQEFVHPLYAAAREKGVIDTRVFVTAHDIAPEWHVRMQAAFQRHTDNAVSKTINLPSNASTDDVRKAYELAWETDCKGITIYRDGSHVGQVLTIAHSDPEPPLPLTSPASLDLPASSEPDLREQAISGRPPVLNSKTIKQASPFGNLYVTVSEIGPNEPFEVFATIGKAGSDVQAMTEAACRIISQLLRMSSLRQSRSERLLTIIEQLNGIGGYSSSGFGSERTRSIPDAIAKALKLYLNGNQVETVDRGIKEPLSPTVGAHTGSLCPDCGQASVYAAEGCLTCRNCGWSQC